MKLTEMVKQKTRVALVALLLFFCLVNSVAAQNLYTDKWQFDLTLYLWATDIDGTVSATNGLLPGGEFDIDVNDIIDNLNMTFMGGIAARKNRWSFIADAIYLGVGNDRDTTLPTKLGVPASVSVDLDIDTWILTGAVGYDVIQGDHGNVAVVGGVRYANMDVDVTLDVQRFQVNQSKSEGLVDGIVGVRGRITLNENWYLPYYADIGTGDSDLTWQALAGIGYQFNWGDIKLVYRYLSYEMDDDGLLKDLDVSGPALGVVFRF